MKQLIPFLVIGVIVVGTLFFLQDDYEEPFHPEFSDEVSEKKWSATFFINDLHSDDVEIGLKLEYTDDPQGIEALEFFVETEFGGFYFQDLNLEEFDGTILYTEECDFCNDFSIDDMDLIQATAVVNWRNKPLNETESAFLQFQLANLAD